MFVAYEVILPALPLISFFCTDRYHGVDTLVSSILGSKIAGNFSWLLGDKVLRMVANLGVAVIVARYLGPERLGAWNYLISFVLFFSIFSSIGLENIVPRELLDKDERQKDVMTTAYRLKLAGGLVGFILCLVVFVLYKRPDIEGLVAVTLVASLLLFQTFDVFDFYFKARLRSKYSVISRNIAFGLMVAVKLILVFIGADLIYFLATTAIEILVAGLLFLYHYKKKYPEVTAGRFDPTLAKSFLRDGIPFALSGFLILIYMRIDQMMVTDMIDETANGIYSTGVRMIEAAYFVPMALGESFFPGIVTARKAGIEVYRQRLTSFYSLMLLGGAVLTLVLALLAHPLMDLLFGADYEGSGAVLFIYALTLFGTFVNIALSKWLTAENHLRIILSRSVIGVLTNLILNFIMIPRFGYIGAAYASLISYYAVTISIFFFGPTRPQASLMRVALRPTNIKALMTSLRNGSID